jgi:hypothetical protein
MRNLPAVTRKSAVKGFIPVFGHSAIATEVSELELPSFRAAIFRAF